MRSLLIIGQQQFQSRDLRAQHRSGRGLLIRGDQERTGLLSHGLRGETLRSIDDRLHGGVELGAGGGPILSFLCESQ